jgi:diguanylate cyclase (GGDEF)-like protein
VVRRLRLACPSADAIARWGGEEFLVLLPGGEAEAVAAAERMRRGVDEHPFDGVGRVTISVGVAVARPGESAREVVGRADAACYRAKAAGRNRVRVAAGPESGGP